MKQPRFVEERDRKGVRAGRASAAPGLAPPLTIAAPASPRCACGGGCLRCARTGIRISAPGDALEQDAERVAGTVMGKSREALDAPALEAGSSGVARLPATLQLTAEQHLRLPIDEVRLHTGPAAHRLAAALGARAFAFRNTIAFGAGEFRPDTDRGRLLIAHELAHVAQQPRTTTPTIHRQPGDVVEMEPVTVRTTLQPTERAVPRLEHLVGEGVDPEGMTAAYVEETIRRNAPPRSQRLPFNAGAWDAEAILTALGQYDTMPETDSDAVRCVQAVAMASRIVDGPAAVVGFLRALILEGMLSRPQRPRQRVALEVLEHVIGRIETERATFGDLLWAQEALHDLFYTDVTGTPEEDILARMAPPLELFGRALVRMNVWCKSPQDVQIAANQLRPGEQLLVNTWQVVFNTAFEQLEEQGIEVAVGRSTVVEVNGRQRRIRRIDMNRRPPHTAIDTLRDLKTGHQLLVLKDGVTGRLRLYEPEITETGRHLEDLDPDGSNFQRYFRDLPDIGIYHYIQIIGKLTPATTPSTEF